ncbi:MAG: PASTA domain-containing protein [Endomicrobia bacterium]|nr:PASTA domain-containing protein [Endomicrobiia bacterium]
MELKNINKLLLHFIENKRFHVVISFIIFSLFIFVSVIVLYYLTGLIVHSKKEVIVPNITGKSVVEALDIVSKSGLGLKKISEIYNPEYPAGTVVVQQPSAGMTVRKGKFVGVVISLGGEKVFVPNIIGEDKRKAEILLRQYDLYIGSVTERYSLRYNKNVVMSQSITPDSIVDRYSFVNIEISLGQPPIGIVLVPDFVNKTVDNLYDWANKNNISVKVNERISGQIQEGTILEQNLAPDTVLTEDVKEIEVTIAKGHLADKNFIQNLYNFEYELPFASNLVKNVKIVQISNEGEYVLYNKPTSAKQKIMLYVPQRKNSKIRIFVDGVLIDEK